MAVKRRSIPSETLEIRQREQINQRKMQLRCGCRQSRIGCEIVMDSRLGQTAEQVGARSLNTTQRKFRPPYLCLAAIRLVSASAARNEHADGLDHIAANA